MRSIEELQQNKTVVLVYKHNEEPIVVIGDLLMMDHKRRWFTSRNYHRIMDERNLWDSEPIGWYPLEY